jgi:RHS repeat-associated protein
MDGILNTFAECLPSAFANIKTNDLYKYVVQPNEQIVSQTEPHYYYLTDHLGSSSYIVNDVGQITQTLAYMPYGEDMVNLVSNQPQYTTPYKFTGKEKDEETGFNYYSSRYYDSYLSIFNSIDPHFFNYPHITSYNYCANNPVMVIDPNGKDVEITRNEDEKKISVKANFYYSKKDINRADNFDVEQGFKQSLDSWKNDIGVALKEEGLGDYALDVQFNMINVDGLDDGKTAEEMAEKDRIGNSITHDGDMGWGRAQVSNNKHLRANMDGIAYNPEPFFNVINGREATSKHEIGHFFGLWDRAKGYENKEHAAYIPNDMMSYDLQRGNAVAPFKRVMQNAGLNNAGNRTVLINIKNRETK